MWTACALSIFQLLSEDYLSYVFFIFFLGIAIGAIRVITIPYVMEMVGDEVHFFSLNIYPKFRFLVSKRIFNKLA